MRIRFAMIGVLAALAACASRPPAAPREILDEQSANTLMVVAAPIVFARERSDVAARAHDFATVVAVEIDASGVYSPYLLLYRWSTVDPRMSPPPPAGAGALRIIADGRVVDLSPLDRFPVGLAKNRELSVPNHGDVLARAYKVDVATLRFIAASREIMLRLPQEPLDIPFRLWEDGRGALGEFVSRAATP
ncbi:MAG: hypothetical protein ACHQIL_13155 [Steroidobacterales bacterium]